MLGYKYSGYFCFSRSSLVFVKYLYYVSRNTNYIYIYGRRWFVGDSQHFWVIENVSSQMYVREQFLQNKVDLVILRTFQSMLYEPTTWFRYFPFGFLNTQFIELPILENSHPHSTLYQISQNAFTTSSCMCLCVFAVNRFVQHLSSIDYAALNCPWTDNRFGTTPKTEMRITLMPPSGPVRLHQSPHRISSSVDRLAMRAHRQSADIQFAAFRSAAYECHRTAHFDINQTDVFISMTSSSPTRTIVMPHRTAFYAFPLGCASAGCECTIRGEMSLVRKAWPNEWRLDADESPTDQPSRLSHTKNDKVGRVACTYIS